ncbi:MAG: xanthine dehydrogenase family protein subunit M [Pseudomonadota bacterium]
MPISNDFEYFKVKSIKEACALLDKYKGKAKILAGGTDLIVWLKEDIVTCDAVIDIKKIKDLDKIELRDGKLFIGALVTFNQLIQSKLVKKEIPILCEASKTVASKGLRNRATLVGNICAAVPSCDGAPALLVYEAEVLVKSSENERVVDINKWFAGPKKSCLKSDEIVVGIEIPLSKNASYGSYHKLGRYKGEDLAQASVAFLALNNKEYKLACGAVGPVPFRALKTEDKLRNKTLNKKLISEAKDVLLKEISPITDIRSSKEYRSHMIGVMFEDACLGGGK